MRSFDEKNVAIVKKVSIKGTLSQISYGKESKQVWMIGESIQ